MRMTSRLQIAVIVTVVQKTKKNRGLASLTWNASDPASTNNVPSEVAFSTSSTSLRRSPRRREAYRPNALKVTCQKNKNREKIRKFVILTRMEKNSAAETAW